jgi:twinkle protein
MELLDDKVNFESFSKRHELGSDLLPARSFEEGLIDEFHGDKARLGLNMPWRALNWFDIRPHETTVWTGYNGHGKSLILGHVILSLMDQGEKAAIASMEMTAQKTMARMAQQALRSYIPGAEDLAKFSEWTDGKLWILNKQESVHWEKIIGVINYAIEEHGVTQFVVDSMMKCGISPDDQNAESAFMENLTGVSQATGCHIHLVAHGRKPFDERVRMTKYEIRGTGHISDKADNVIIMSRNIERERALKNNPTEDQIERYKNQPDAWLTVDKQRHGTGELGDLWLFYNTDSTSYCTRPNCAPVHILREFKDEPFSEDEGDQDTERGDSVSGGDI